jgi:hypothetical protein
LRSGSGHEKKTLAALVEATSAKLDAEPSRIERQQTETELRG